MKKRIIGKGYIEEVHRFDGVPSCWAYTYGGQKKLFTGKGAQSQAFKFIHRQGKQEQIERIFKSA